VPVDVPATGTGFRDVTVDASGFGSETRKLYIVFAGADDVRLNFFEAIGQGSSPVEKPRVRITAPEEGVQLDPDTDVQVTAAASDPDGTITEVEFYVGEDKIGEDATAPYEVTWRTPAAEDLYSLTAVAMDNDGNTRRSRVVVAQVGELFGDLVPFSNVDGTVEKVGAGAFSITGAGDNTWQSVDEYSSLYLPGGADDDSWEAVVKVNGQTHTNGSAKTGIMVRNDMTAPGQSAGYAFVGIRPANGVEFLRDTNGDGQLDASSAAGTTAYPTWIKLVRDGSQYSAYYSRNGSTWNQVGGPATLAGAATTQDVGMATTAHSGTIGTAEFEAFSVDSDPEPVDPEETYAALGCPTGPLSDEFTGGLNGKWSVRQPTGFPVRTVNGQLQLPVAPGDINESSAGPVSFVGQPVPAGDWTVTTKLTLAHTSHWQWAGLVVHQNDNEYNKLAFVRNQNGSRFIEFQSETGGSRTTPAAPTLPADFPTTIHLRLTNTAGTLTGAYSTSGEDGSWTNLNGSLQLKGNARLGLMAAGDLGTAPVNATVDWFRVTPDREAPEVAPDDEFDGTALDGCRWSETVRYDADAVEVTDGHLEVTTQPGDINGNNPLNPRNFVLQDAPEGDWVATTRFKAPLKHRYQLAGLLMYGDDDNYAKADVVAYNGPGAALDLRAELAAEAGGAGVPGGDQLNIADSTESGYWYLRVTKAGTSYTAEVSDDGSQWDPIGDGITFAEPIRALGLMAIGPQQEEPVVVAFDYFHLGGDEPVDTTAPTTELTLDPATADGDNGWYVTAPSFTLTADDADGSGVESTEYRVGDGEWTAYDGEAVSLADAADGEVVVDYRSTDVAGNTEEVRSTTVKLDREAPEVSVTGLVAGRTYSHAAQPTLGWTTTATGAPVDGVVATIGGRTVAKGRLEVWRLPLGRNVLTVKVTDEAGNSTTVRVAFRVDTSIAAVRTLVQRFADQGSMSRTVERRILAQLGTAAQLVRRGRDRQAATALVRARELAAGIRVAAHRDVVRDDLTVLVRRLR
jgi:regulation of enolase protein 1 (concanavalin A-like superfamily)